MSNLCVPTKQITYSFGVHSSSSFSSHITTYVIPKVLCEKAIKELICLHSNASSPGTSVHRALHSIPLALSCSQVYMHLFSVVCTFAFNLGRSTLVSLITPDLGIVIFLWNWKGRGIIWDPRSDHSPKVWCCNSKGRRLTPSNEYLAGFDRPV